MQKLKNSCKTTGCYNVGQPITFAGKTVLLCPKCRVELFKALLSCEVPKGTTSKFKI